MTLEEFAKLSGVTVFKTDPFSEFDDGNFGYKEDSVPRMVTTGYQTKREAYEGWLELSFTKDQSKAILELLKQTQGK